MMKITGLSHLFKWENLHNWWLTKYFFAPLYIAGLGRDQLEHLASPMTKSETSPSPNTNESKTSPRR